MNTIVSVMLSVVSVGWLAYINVRIAQRYRQTYGKTRLLFGVIEYTQFGYKYNVLIPAVAAVVLAVRTIRNTGYGAWEIVSMALALVAIVGTLTPSWKLFIGVKRLIERRLHLYNTLSVHRIRAVISVSWIQYSPIKILYFKVMDLLSRDLLEQSATVANNRMNRERNAVGVNSYERDIWLSPLKYLGELAQDKKSVHWLDLCCGRGKAIIQSARVLNAAFPGYPFHFTGIDLVDMYDARPSDSDSISFVTESFFGFETAEKYDLITCVHGLHYLGDKLAAIQKACALLTADGLLVANLDLHNFRNSAQEDFHKTIARWLRENNLVYNPKRHLLTVRGNRSLRVPFRYVGADDQAGPNYTKQAVVDSYYEY